MYRYLPLPLCPRSVNREFYARTAICFCLLVGGPLSTRGIHINIDEFTLVLQVVLLQLVFVSCW